MSYEKAPKFWRLLAFRLTLWYCGVLLVSALLCFVISYFVVLTAMQNRTDTDLLRQAARCAESLRQGGLAALRNQIENDARATGTNDIFLIAYDAAGEALASSDMATWKDMTPPPPALNGATARFDDGAGTGHHGQLRILTAALDGGTTIQAGITTQDDARVMDQVRRIGGAILAALILVAVPVGWFLARRALAGVQQVTNTANEISRGSLDRRVPITGWGDEIDQLAATVNRMLGRIAALVEGMKATNDNIAHELRSPIARMRGLAEMTLTSESSLGDFQDMAASTIEECDGLLGMINTMLDIAEGEAGVIKLEMASFNISALLRKLCELYEPVMVEKGIHLEVEAAEIATVCGDVQKLQRVGANLLDNAVKYTPKGGTISVSVVPSGPTTQYSVSNTGPGIAMADVPHIFERFYRADKSRSGSGNGLGLSLVHAIVHAHGGQISVQSVPEVRTTFTVTLPTASSTSRGPARKITNL
jgi:heavy metal sensor kinase